ncbi:hypothetical protein ABPG73_020332 [Tetrahymena malaccensis]
MSGSGGYCKLCQKLTNQRCSGCKVAYYCSQEHSKLDWQNHKQDCKRAQQVNSSQVTVNSNANKEQVIINSEQNGLMNNNQFSQKQDSNTQNLSITSNNATNQPNNNLNSSNSNQSQLNQPAVILTPGNIKTRQSNNATLVDQQSPQVQNSYNYNNINQNNQNNQMINMTINDNIAQRNYKDNDKLQKDRELHQLINERLAFRSDVVKLLAKFNYSDALISVRNLCKISDKIYSKRPDLNELYELLADQLLEVKVMIKTQSSNANKEAGTKLQDIFHKIKQKMNDNALKNYYQELQVEKKNEFMNEIRKRCNLISLVANLFYSLGHQNECEEAYVRYVKLIENVMGQDALETSNCYFLMGVYYLQHRYYIKALACFKRSMSIRSQRLTERHESVTDCQYNIGIAYKQLGRKQKALDQLEKTLFIRRQIIGQSSLPVAQTLEILGKIYMESPSDYPIALDKFQECYSIRKSIIKVNKHPDMVRISLLIVHLYNLIKAQLAQQEASQPSKQAQQLKEIELKMQKNVIDGNIQQYIQTQKNNPDRFQELQNQYGLYNNDMLQGALNQANAIQKQQNQASSQVLLPDNSVDDLLKNQNQAQNNSSNPSAFNNNNKSNLANGAINSVMNSMIKPSSGISDKNYGFGQQRGSVANSFQLRERQGSKQSTDSNSPSKTIQEEEPYQPQKKNNSSRRNKSNKKVSEEISEDSDNSDEDQQEKNIKKYLLKLREKTISRITHQQFQELVNINEKIATEMKKDPKFNPRDMIINSVFVQNMKQMDYRDICQDLIDMNPQYFSGQEFSDLRYTGADINQQSLGNNQFDQKMNSQYQQQPSAYDYQQQNIFQNQSNQGSFGKQSQYQQQNGFYQMSDEYSFPQSQQKPRPEQTSYKKYYEERTDMQMDPNEDFMDILNKKPSNRSPSRDGNQKFGASNNYGVQNSSNQYNQVITKNVRIASQEVYQYNNQKQDFEVETSELPPMSKLMSQENAQKMLNGLRIQTPTKPVTLSQVGSNQNLNQSLTTSPPQLAQPEKLDPNYQANQQMFPTQFNTQNSLQNQLIQIQQVQYDNYQKENKTDFVSNKDFNLNENKQIKQQQQNQYTNQNSHTQQIQNQNQPDLVRKSEFNQNENNKQIKQEPQNQIQNSNAQKIPNQNQPLNQASNSNIQQIPNSNQSSPDRQRMEQDKKMQQELIDLKQEQNSMLESQKSAIAQEKEKLQIRNSQLEKEKKQQIQEISQLNEQLRSKSTTQTQQIILEESIRRKTNQLQEINQQIEMQNDKQKQLDYKAQQEIQEQNEKLKQYEQKIKELEEKLKKKELESQLILKQNSSLKSINEQQSLLQNSQKQTESTIPPPPPPPINQIIPPPPPPPLKIPSILNPPVAPPLMGIPPIPNMGIPQVPQLGPQITVPKSKTKPLHCEAVDQIQKTFWADVKEIQAIEFEGLEEKFSNQNNQNQFKKQMTEKTPSQKYLETINKNQTQLNNNKKSLFQPDKEKNLNIEFKQFLKKGSIEELLEGFQKLNEKLINEEDCQKLLKILNKDDIKKYEQFNGDRQTLDSLSQLTLGILEISYYRERLIYFTLQKEFNQRLQELTEHFNILLKTSNALIQNSSIKEFLFQALALSKKMNEGGPKEKIKGIKIQSIIELKQQKSTDRTTDILQFLVTQTYNQKPEYLSFVDELTPLLNQSKHYDIDEDSLQSKQLIDKFEKLGNLLSKELYVDGQIQDLDFYNFFQPFYEQNYNQIIEFNQLVSQTNQQYKNCYERFGETKIKSNEFFKTLLTICDMVKNEIPNKMFKSVRQN